MISIIACIRHLIPASHCIDNGWIEISYIQWLPIVFFALRIIASRWILVPQMVPEMFLVAGLGFDSEAKVGLGGLMVLCLGVSNTYCF